MIDDLEICINEEVVCIIVLCVFVFKDLWIILIVLKIVVSFECMGDYVKNMVKWIYVLLEMCFINGFDVVLCCMVREV